MSSTSKLIESGDIEVCPCCGGLNAYTWDLTDQAAGIAHIPTASCWEWQCGHCGAYLCSVDAPIMAEVYTHIDPADMWID